jgi:hypothetical protein
MNPLFWGLKSLPREYIKLWSVCRCSSAVSPQGFGLQRENTVVLVMLSIVLLMASKAASAVSPCSITSISLFPNFGLIARRFYQERTWFQALKTQSTREPACRVYPDKREAHKTPSLDKDLSRLHNVVILITLVVLYYTLYRIHIKCGILLEISISSHMPAFTLP